MKRKIEQVGNVCTVVCTFHGVPCAVSVYPNERDALKAYKSQIEIHDEVAEKQAGHKVDRKESMGDKSRAKTSCSGLPNCVFDDGYGVAVVRGPRYDVMKKRDKIPYVAVLWECGDLNVTCFEDAKQAEESYKEIKEYHKNDLDMYETYYPEGKSFSTDEISAAVGAAVMVGKGEPCQIV